MAGKSTGAACNACRFYDDHKLNGGAASHEAGLCRYNPPVSQPAPQAQGLWPVVAAQDWCGHFASDVGPAE